MQLPQNNETICAISTPQGVGGIAVIRLSGPRAIAIADSIWRGKALADTPGHRCRLGDITDTDGNILDNCVATVFRGPHSFTGEDTVEFAVHGSRYIQRALLDTLIDKGARLAEAGEYTRRAFTAGHLDLAQAEAVADVISSNSRAAHRLAIKQMRGNFSQRLEKLRDRLIDLASLLELELDFSEEEVEFASRLSLRELAKQIHDEVSRLADSFASGHAIKDGIPVAIIGATNAGKSSLLNALIGDNRAIVSEIHGTTRDTIEETIELGDYHFRFIDTAGLRHTDDTIEQIGIERSRQAIGQAVIVILVIDPAAPLDPDILTTASTPLNATPRPGDLIALINKSDSAITQQIDTVTDRLRKFRQSPNFHILSASSLTGQGLDHLHQILVDIAQREEGSADEGLLVTNLRHAQSLRAAAESTARVIDGLDANLSGDLIAQDLRQTIHHLSAITGTITTTDILTTIFSRFCVGK